MREITLPVPPALNAMYRVRGGGKGLYKTPECKVYEQEVFYLTRGIRLLEGNVSLHLHFFFERDNRDIDGGLKILLDVLQGRMYKNDKQINSLTILKTVDKDNPHVVVWATSNDR